MNQQVSFWADVAGILAFIVVVLKPTLSFLGKGIKKVFKNQIEIYKYNKAIRTGKFSYKQHRKLKSRFEQNIATPQERDRYLTLVKDMQKLINESNIQLDHEQLKNVTNKIKDR